MAVCLWRNRRQLQRGAATGKVPRPVPSPRCTGSYDTALVSLGSEAVTFRRTFGLTRGSNVTRHPSPLSMGDRSEATGETLGSEARSTTSQYDDGDEQSSGGGLPTIPEGEEGPPSPNATVSEARSALQELAEKAAEMKRLPSPVKSGKRSGGQSWLTHSDEYALQLSMVTDSYSSLGPEARLLDRRLRNSHTPVGVVAI